MGNFFWITLWGKNALNLTLNLSRVFALRALKFGSLLPLHYYHKGGPGISESEAPIKVTAGNPLTKLCRIFT